MTKTKWFRNKDNSDLFDAFNINWSIRADKLSYPRAFVRSSNKDNPNLKIKKRGTGTNYYYTRDEYYYSSKKAWYFKVIDGQYEGSIGVCKTISLDYWSSAPRIELKSSTVGKNVDAEISFDNVELLRDYKGPLNVELKQRNFEDEEFVLHQNAYSQYLEKDAYVMASIRNYPFIGKVVHSTNKKVFVKPADIYKKTLNANEQETVNFLNFKTAIIVIDEDIAEETITLCSIGGF